jgi:hypothetical protein
MADTSPAVLREHWSSDSIAEITAIAFHRIVVFEAATELGRVREAPWIVLRCQEINRKMIHVKQICYFGFGVADADRIAGANR